MLDYSRHRDKTILCTQQPARLPAEFRVRSLTQNKVRRTTECWVSLTFYRQHEKVDFASIADVGFYLTFKQVSGRSRELASKVFGQIPALHKLYANQQLIPDPAGNLKVKSFRFLKLKGTSRVFVSWCFCGNFKIRV